MGSCFRHGHKFRARHLVCQLVLTQLRSLSSRTQKPTSICGVKVVRAIICAAAGECPLYVEFLITITTGATAATFSSDDTGSLIAMRTFSYLISCTRAATICAQRRLLAICLHVPLAKVGTH